MCSQRIDDWAREVKYRVLDCHDFVAAEARYHNSCYSRFFLRSADLSATPGRPTESEKSKFQYDL